MRAIDADALIEKCGGWYVDECTESGFIGTLKDILATEPTIQPEVLACGNGELVAQPEPTDIDAKEAVYNLAEKIGIHQLFALTVELRGEPIQPELTDEQVIDYCGKKGYKIVADDLFDLLSKPEPHWIPVSERLPEVHESGNSVSGIYMQSNPVLVYGTCEYEDNAQFHVVTYCDDLDGNTYWSTELDAITVSGVLAWMPLPEPYTK